MSGFGSWRKVNCPRTLHPRAWPSCQRTRGVLKAKVKPLSELRERKPRNLKGNATISQHLQLPEPSPRTCQAASISETQEEASSFTLVPRFRLAAVSEARMCQKSGARYLIQRSSNWDSPTALPLIVQALPHI